MTRLHPVFREVCDRESVRYDLEKPFTQGDYLYATDGRIAVRQRLDLLDPERREWHHPGMRRIPNVQPLFDKLDRHGRVDVELDPGINLQCPACQHCNPDGLWQWPFTIGSCEHCDGEGCLGPDEVDVPAGPISLNGFYLEFLAKYGVRSLSVIDKPLAPAYFKTDDFEGLLMPMEKPK
jgi:hypothetical protein